MFKKEDLIGPHKRFTIRKKTTTPSLGSLGAYNSPGVAIQYTHTGHRPSAKVGEQFPQSFFLGQFSLRDATAERQWPTELHLFEVSQKGRVHTSLLKNRNLDANFVSFVQKQAKTCQRKVVLLSTAEKAAKGNMCVLSYPSQRSIKLSALGCVWLLLFVGALLVGFQYMLLRPARV